MASLAQLLVLVSLTAGPSAPAAASPGPAAGAHDVLVAEVDAIIHPVSAEFMVQTIDRADTSGAAAVVFVLRTPGGLLESTQTIVSRMIGARTPIVVFVGPAGARAASAGFLIVLASDVAVMAPGTHIGAAHPVSGTGEAMNETVAKKAASDVAAYARSLAEARGRNVSLAAEAVTSSRAFTDTEALHAAPPLIDFIARDVDDVVRQLDGRTIARFDGRRATLHTAGARIAHVEMTWREQFLSAIAHPQIAYLLFSLGMLGLTIELWMPGAIAPGVVGGVSLLLAFFAFQVLPVNTAGLLLIGLGIGLLVLELKVPSGVLGLGGAVSLVLGSVMLTSEVPGVAVRLPVILATVGTFAVIFLVLGRLALTAQRRRAVTGIEGMLGTTGRAITAIDGASSGKVTTHGEIWQATAKRPVAAGQSVRIVAVDGLTLAVEPVDDRAD
jgi:membrane-bound serine protease (ClpP class)